VDGKRKGMESKDWILLVRKYRKERRKSRGVKQKKRGG
jgi:hypothetical protein